MTARRTIGAGLLTSRIVAVVRGGNGRHVQAACETLIEAGISCIEVTTNTPGGADALKRLRNTYGDEIELGLGTVRNTAHVAMASELGANFVVAPNTVVEVGQAAMNAGLAWYPGALTPTEISLAWNRGATAVKVFPAGPVGGPDYLNSIRAPLDDIPLIPTGGVLIDSICDYLQAGAVAVGLGGPLIGRTLHDGAVEDLARRAKQAVDAVCRARAPV
ncbi:bifunctional 4-hydroxy-2-oxoglutarate aldolase/2-dehydro-3-deoxy-phosphogluconate aldolase [Terrabacter terrigena]|uniref:Bifunctional 4-hydroxy-2-oxoglutarate aldolase/2-dehydro-3-deoxy-phosphogluconate aldolase n=1 Tax=Terrabacter terrigena TaxID=574718 RepID=A0ABW3N1B2_9MICO